MAIDGFFLEYDDERSGDFAPLRFMPKGKMIILGIHELQALRLEEKDALKKRIDEAAHYVPLDQCGLNDQCGFSSTAHAPDPTKPTSGKKLARTVEVAREVWGEA